MFQTTVSSRSTVELPTAVLAAPEGSGFDLDAVVQPIGDMPDRGSRIFASETAAPCQCGTGTCH